ncbi:unnamed protein product, partial [Closterium sp. NIES-64]
MKHQRCHQLSALKAALPAALSPALTMALWLVAFNVSSCHAQVINASQGLFLSDVKTGWGMGWKVGDKCSTAASILCDASGMITSMDLSSNSLTGSIPDSITALTALGYLNLRKNNLTGPIPDSLPVPQSFFPSASPPPPKPADGGLVPRWAVPSTSPPPPKPS